MENKPIVLKRSVGSYLSHIFWYNVGKIINRCFVAYNVYKTKNSEVYNLSYSRLSSDLLNEKNRYVNTEGYEYKDVHIMNGRSEDSSQYYLYKNVIGSDPATVCNIGAFYCGADYEYLNSHAKSKVYALDFGDMEKLNQNIKHKRLFLYSGYPLDSLGNLLKEKGEYFFDYVIFTRTAVLINKNELKEYMNVICKLAKNVAFLEVVDISTLDKRTLYYDSISIDNPLKMYSGMYIHNYIRLIEKFGFRCTKAEILPPGSFPNESANGHHLICVVGKMN